MKREWIAYALDNGKAKLLARGTNAECYEATKGVPNAHMRYVRKGCVR